MEIVIAVVASVAVGMAVGWRVHDAVQRADLNRRYRRSVRIAARSYKRRQIKGRPRKVFTAGDDYMG